MSSPLMETPLPPLVSPSLLPARRFTSPSRWRRPCLPLASLCGKSSSFLLLSHLWRRRVVSMPCWELFQAQPIEYKREVFPDGVPVISVEASSTHGWAEWSHSAVGLTTFGLSAPAPQVYERFGLTVGKIVEHAHRVVEYYKANPVPSLVNRIRFEGSTAHH
jgi:hypothetical protein